MMARLNYSRVGGSKEMLSQLAPLEGGEETTAAENEGQPGGDGSIWGRAAIDRGVCRRRRLH